jgi:hypothetical protein
MGDRFMGGLFDSVKGASLTKPALVDSNGKPTYYNSVDDALNAGTAKLSSASPTVTVTPPSNPTFTGTTVPMPEGQDGPEQEGAPLMTGGGGSLTLTSPAAKLPIFKQPTFQQASTDPNSGMPVANTPGLTKAGKLLQVLSLAAKGAMAGQAASNEAVIQSGGHRSGGIGLGFMAGLEEPEREAMNNLGVQRAALGNQLEQAQISALPVLRAAQLAHTAAETNSLNQHAEYLKSLAQIKDKDKLAQMHADAVNTAIEEGRDPQQDPKVLAIQDAITAVQRQPATKNPVLRVMGSRTYQLDPQTNQWSDVGPAPEHTGSGTENEYRDFKKENPNATVEDFWAARNGTPKSATRGQFAEATVRKNNAFRALNNQYSFVPETGEYKDNKTGDTISPDEFTRKKQDIQDSYEEQVAGLSGQAPQHVEIPVADAQAKPRGGAQPAAQTPAAPAPKVDISKATKRLRNPKTGQIAYLVGNSWVDQNGQPLK